MALNNSVLVAITEISLDLDPAAPLEARLRTAMAEARRHWLVTREEECFQAAVGAVLMTASDEEKARLEAELDAMATLALLTASGEEKARLEALSEQRPADPAALPTVTLEAPVGLMRLWGESA